MGIQINGQTDTISASDGSLVVSGAELPTVGNINATGIITATTFSGDVTGNATGLSGTPNLNVGIITATSFSGDGSGLTGVGGTDNVVTDSLVVAGVTTVSAGSTASPSITPTGDSNTGIFFPAADTIAFGEGGAEAVRITDQGYVAIARKDAGTNLHVGSENGVIRVGGNAAGGSGLDIDYSNSGNTTTTLRTNYRSSSNLAQLKLDSGYITFHTGTSGTEWVRITNNGQFTVQYSSTTGVVNTYGHAIYGAAAANTNSTALADQRCGFFLRSSMQNTNNEAGNSCLLIQDSGGAAVTKGDLIKGYSGSSYVFRVANNGAVQNSPNSYGALSDERLKQDITDANSAWNDVKNYRVRKFRLKDDVEYATEHPELGEAPYMLGVVAQEIEQVSPGLVDCVKLDDGTPDPDSMKSVKYSILYMKAVKALQEAMERIEVLEEKVNTLENNS